MIHAHNRPHGNSTKVTYTELNLTAASGADNIVRNANFYDMIIHVFDRVAEQDGVNIALAVFGGLIVLCLIFMGFCLWLLSRFLTKHNVKARLVTPAHDLSLKIETTPTKRPKQRKSKDEHV